MTESSDKQFDREQPYRPSMRGAWRYDVLRKAEVAANSTDVAAIDTNKRLFTMTITATSKEGENMDDGQDEKQFLFTLVFKPDKDGLRLRPEITQLLLAHMSELFRQVEIEEQGQNELV